MYATINNHTIENVEWTGTAYDGLGLLTFPSNETFSVISTWFEPQGVLNIYDENDNLVCEWYNTSLRSINETIDGIRKIQVNVKVTPITDSIKTIIQSNIDEDEDAIIELADVLDRIEVLNSGINDTVEELRTRLNDVIDSIDALSNQYNNLADRVARLENKGGN